MFDWMNTSEGWVALATLTVLELVLGIDNVIFISILADKLPPEQRERARRTGLFLAMFMRLALLGSISIIVGFVQPLFSVTWFGHAHSVSGRDLVLIAGGLFLLYKATTEIHDKLEGKPGHASAAVQATFGAVIAQIVLLDLVFSLDSVITAVGMTRHIAVMMIAVVLSVAVMLLAARPLSEFVSSRPTVKILALSFLLLIGMALVADGLHQHIEKGYIYFAMGFSVLVEMFNLRYRSRHAVVLHQPYVAESGSSSSS